LWSVHPVLTDSVTNIVGRADLLATTGVLGGFVMYLKSVETVGWRRILWLAGVAAAAAAGASAKESAVVLPAAINFYEPLCRKRPITWMGSCWEARRHLIPIA
jgi:hypothetical protein